MSQQALRVNGSAVLSIIFVCIILYAVYSFYPSADSEEVLLRNKLPVEPGKSVFKMDKVPWETTKERLTKDASLIIKEQNVNIDDVNSLFYREALPPNGAKPHGTILFLHGQKFKSLTWHELGTLHFLSKNGFRAVAVDLPGYGNTKSFETDNKADFMMNSLKSLGISEAIIVSPSMSGGFSLPLLFSHPEVFKGYVPVAPVGTGSYSKEKYEIIKVPTCIIYGENDQSLGQTSLLHLSNLPNKEIHMLPDAGHPAYLDRPKEFHEYLLNFANRIFAAKL